MPSFVSVLAIALAASFFSVTVPAAAFPYFSEVLPNTEDDANLEYFSLRNSA
ncbi:MAG: hypothetical protein QG650_1064, partial [Patescibacteria group bacterium]|nr:hypothetical protein [Patescibacteria group bacterium]